MQTMAIIRRFGISSFRRSFLFCLLLWLFGIGIYFGCFFIQDNFNFEKDEILDASHQDQCNVEWPDFELFLPTGPQEDLEKEFNDWFLPSLALFYPRRHLKLLIATDLEKPASPAFIERSERQVRALIPGIKSVRSAFVPQVHNLTGWSKSQWLKFWADNYTSSAYIGFVDTDTTFVTRVTRDDLFEGDKPIMRPMYGKPRLGWVGGWANVTTNTYKYTGLKEPFNCMSFFPVIIKTEHLPFIREVLVRHLNGTNFDDVFGPIAIKGMYGFYSEFNMMCAVLWWHFRDDYYWIINEVEPGWHGPPPEGQVANLEEAEITEEMLARSPRPHLAIHFTYYPNFKSPETIVFVLKLGVCYSLTQNQPKIDECHLVNRTDEVNPDEFTFEYDDFGLRPGALSSHLARLQNNEVCPHDWIGERVAELFDLPQYLPYV